MKKRIFDIKIKSAKDFKLEYAFYSPQGSKDNNELVFVYFHGLPGAPVNELSQIPTLLGELGYSTICFNYPGMWSKNGFFSSTDVINGITGLLNDVKVNLNVYSINIFGESFGGAVALTLLGRNNSPIPVNKIILRSPLLDVRPLLSSLPTSFYYLKQAKIINIQSVRSLLDDVKVLDPTQYFSQICSNNTVKIWGVIGKNDDVLPADKMLKAIRECPAIDIELWDDFPHNDIDDILYKKFSSKIQEFMKN